MAGGKLTPRQKMINLMYLVFIAMLAMNVSKEVISGFGLMNEKFESSNTNSKQSNDQMLLALDAKAAEAKGEFTAAATTAHKVKTITDNFYNYIESLKRKQHKAMRWIQKLENCLMKKWIKEIILLIGLPEKVILKKVTKL